MSTMADDMIPRPESLLLPMTFPQKLLLGPGPSNAPPRVLAAGAMPILGHMHSEFWQILDEIKEGIQYIFQTKNKLTLAISGTGHAGMEAACCNIIEPKDVVLVAHNGIWGDRFGDLAERHDGDVRYLKKDVGTVFSMDEIEKALQQHKPNVMFITHGESSGGTVQNLEGLGHLCHKYDTLLMVDSVAALGGVPMYMDKWGIDVLYTGSQKVLSSPAGSAPISFSQRAWEKIKNRKTKVRSFYFDMNWLGNYWGCDDQPRKYHHTAMSNVMYNLRESLSIIAEEGLEACWERHKQAALMLHEGLEKMGLKMFVKDPVARLPCVSTICVPDGLDWKGVCGYAMSKYKIEIAGGLGPTAGKAWRIGLMGYNANADSVKRVLRVLDDSIKHVQSQTK